MNEAETRAEHIDPALAAAGWGVVEGSRIRRECKIAPGRIEGHGRRGKALIAGIEARFGAQMANPADWKHIRASARRRLRTAERAIEAAR